MASVNLKSMAAPADKTIIDLQNKTIFITGVAGFIGANLAKRLLNEIPSVVVAGFDNMND